MRKHQVNERATVKLPTKVNAPAKTRVIAFNKPYDVLSQFTEEVKGQNTLAQFGLPSGVYAAGRLDRDSEGLLLLTDDGPLIKRLLDPRNGHERTYLVQVEGEITDAAIRSLCAGVSIGDHKTLPATARKTSTPRLPDRTPPIRVRNSIPTSWIELTLTEGKNRQVRRMTAAVGFPTLRLVRISIAHMKLGDLLPGEWRELRADEIKKLKQ